ncbi:MAG: DNA-binding domain-containing protein [Myxococcaceae bacterium]|nr:DNA-binding domain-containing protein [Myxococcaceae bacterium]
MKLAQVQDTLFQAVMGEGALAESAALIRSGALTPEDRIGIYAEMYWLRMRDTLRADYPFVWHVLGDEPFDVLVARHIRRRPSTHYSLGRLGSEFAETLRDAHLEWPWVVDLAKLEWARAEAFISPDAPVLAFAALGALSDETFHHSRLQISPSVRLLKPTWDVLTVWRTCESGGDWRAIAVTPNATPVVVWRQGFAVFHVAVGSAEHDALSKAQQGFALPTVCEAFADAPEPAQAAFQAIGSWVSEGMVSSLKVDGG